METTSVTSTISHKAELKQQRIEYLKDKKRKESKEQTHKKRLHDAQERDKLLEGKSSEEREQILLKMKEEKEQKHKELVDSLEHGQRICIDIQFADTMSPFEKNSLIKQISLCHRANRNSTNHISLNVCGLIPEEDETLSKSGGKSWIVNYHKESIEKVFSPTEMLYMSPDGPNILEKVDPNKVYIIGGIVDRTVNKNLSLTRATSLSIPAYRLPIKEYIPECTKPVLNINTMIEIFLDYLQIPDWKLCLQKCIPKRKLEKKNIHGDYDYHTIEEKGGINAIKHTELLKYQIKHFLDIYCTKAQALIKIHSVPRDQKYKTTIIHDNQILYECCSKNPRFTTSVASYYALLKLEERYGYFNIITKEISNETQKSINSSNYSESESFNQSDLSGESESEA
ncbi:hypothetical protein WA158_004630 [Blastocystis sp. Blastoise]